MEAVAAPKITLLWSNLVVLSPALLLKFKATAMAKADPYSSFDENTSEGPHVLKGTHYEINFMIPVKLGWG